MTMSQQTAKDPQLRARIGAIILQLLQDQLTTQGPSVGPLDSTTALFGRDGCLDSLGLVSLVVGVEQALQDELNVTVSLADEKALSQRHSPYRTVGSLVDYAVSAI